MFSIASCLLIAHSRDELSAIRTVGVGLSLISLASACSSLSSPCLPCLALRWNVACNVPCYSNNSVINHLALPLTSISGSWVSRVEIALILCSTHIVMKTVNFTGVSILHVSVFLRLELCIRIKLGYKLCSYN